MVKKTEEQSINLCQTIAIPGKNVSSNVVYQLSQGVSSKPHSVVSHFCAHTSPVYVILGLSAAKQHSVSTFGLSSISMIATTVAA